MMLWQVGMGRPYKSMPCLAWQGRPAICQPMPILALRLCRMMFWKAGMGRSYLSFQVCSFAEVLHPDKMLYVARLRQAISKQAIEGRLV
jgi:hypothetical protein